VYSLCAVSMMHEAMDKKSWCAATAAGLGVFMGEAVCMQHETMDKRVHIPRNQTSSVPNFENCFFFFGWDQGACSNSISGMLVC
jgi:hypothetical protein